MMIAVDKEKDSPSDNEMITGMFEKTGKNNATVFDLIKQYLVEKKKKHVRENWLELFSMITYTLPFCLYGFIRALMIIWSDVSFPLFFKIVLTICSAPALFVVSFITALPPLLMDAPQPENLVRKLFCKIMPGFKRKEEAYYDIQNKVYAHINSQNFQYAYLAHLQIQMKNVLQCQEKWQQDQLLNQKELAKSKEVIEHLKANHDRLVNLIMEEDNNENSIIHTIKHIEDYLKENALGLEENQKIKARKNFINGYAQFLQENNVVDVIKAPQSASSVWEHSDEQQINAGLKNHL